MSGLRIKEVCKEKGVSLSELAERLGVTASAVSQYIKSPSLGTINKIARALEVEPADLVVRDSGIDGFIEVKGTIYRIRSKKDIEQVLEAISGNEAP